MTLYFEEEGEARLPIECEKIARQVIETTLDYAGCPYEWEVSLLLTQNEEIRKMNRDFRGIDRPTDVLSFHPESGELMLGDIVISKEKVLSQAEEFGHSALREYAFLIAHSVLHLIGYDHMQDEERQIMERKQKEIMERLNILR